ncbi:tetratricopeptide (TPR) repeat protein [Silvimonas terrae]|uniref:Tetratricopeptide (TPR) repeat protein n=1 Tax=Silvimonas terrae TaxID=300266 RepID=A0A840RI29_9NEIS|nr:tetratricopeptide repeat protein [Silvimonas terrae]MBB5193319.1 tetratricopeptide (TPR) repeat protein [Silvimonas terrae]
MKHGFIAAALMALALGTSAGVWASGGGGGGGGGQSSPPSVMAAHIKAKLDARDWQGALSLLDEARQQQPRNADWWNYTGYAQRNLGHLPESFAAYEEALRLNPKHLGAHEYLGEAYLQDNQPDKAREQLKQLQALCGHCDEYQDLEEAISDYTAKHPG